MFTRHVGKHGDRKVAVVFREVPGETHMALVVYTETLGQNIHDPMMSTIEGDIGQNSEHLADALNRTYTKDGRQILQVLHGEGLLKKVNTEQIVMTPSPSQKIKLNELNKILDEMKLGEDAVKKLAEMDASLGLQDPRDVARRMRGEKDAKVPSTPPKNVQATGNDALGDAQLANNLRSQAQRMVAEAKGLMAEAERLNKEADGMSPQPKTTTKKTTKKAKTKVEA
jgi:hypothetical protein